MREAGPRIIRWPRARSSKRSPRTAKCGGGYRRCRVVLENRVPAEAASGFPRSRPSRSGRRSSRPTVTMAIASARNWNRIAPRVAPSDFRTPISRVRCVTDTSMMLARPMPPIASVSEPISPSSTCSAVDMVSMIFMNSLKTISLQRALVVGRKIMHAREDGAHVFDRLLCGTSGWRASRRGWSDT